MKRYKWFCNCSKCGAKTEVDGSKILTVQPPKYDYTCSKCGHMGYVLCSEAWAEEVEEIPTVQKPNLDYEYEAPKAVTDISSMTGGQTCVINPMNSHLYSKCLVCNEEVEVSMYSTGGVICKECKEAILWVKNKMKEEKRHGKQRRISEMRKNSR